MKRIRLDSSHFEKTLDSIATLSPSNSASVSPSVTPSNRETYPSVNQTSTDASNSRNHDSIQPASNIIGEVRDADVSILEYGSLSSCSIRLRSPMLESAISDPTTPSILPIIASRSPASHLFSPSLLALRGHISTMGQSLTTNNQVGVSGVRTISNDPMIPSVNENCNMALNCLGTRYGDDERTMIHHRHDSCEDEGKESESTVSATGPSDEWICDLAEEMLSSWGSHIRDRRKMQPALITCTGSHLPASSMSGERQACSQNKAAATKHTQKRHRSSYREDDFEDRPRKRPNNAPDSTLHEGAAVVHLLACPFYKKNPTRFSILNTMERRYRGCSNRYLQDIGRLKQHLHRNHERPPNYCGRCYETFPTRTLLDLHTNQPVRCQAADPRYGECMTAEQALDIRKKYPLLGIEENWYRIWRILFPESVPPDSPYVESAMGAAIASFLAYFRDQAPIHIRASLQAAGIILHSGIERATTDRVLEEAVSQILSGYHATQDQSPTIQNYRTGPRRHLAERSQSTSPSPSQPDYTEAQGLPVSTDTPRRPFQVVRQPVHVPTPPSPSNSPALHFGEGPALTNQVPQAGSNLSPGAFPDCVDFLDPNGADQWSFQLEGADGIYPALAMEPRWDWDDTLA